MFFRRKDATLIKDLHPLKRFFPYLMRRRCDSAVYFRDKVRIKKTLEWLREKNSQQQDKRYTLFYVFLAAGVRAIALKPQLNRFIMGRRYYEHDDITLGFIAKKKLTEEAGERNVQISFDPMDTFDEVAVKVYEEIHKAKTEESNTQEDGMEMLFKIPEFILNFVMKIMAWMDQRGSLSLGFTKTDALHISGYITNLGSIGIKHPPFHHMFEWGTTSMFLAIGRMHKDMVIDGEGNTSIEDIVEFTMFLDERVADGVYYANAIKLYMHLVENPELLEEKPDLSKAK